MSFMGMLDRVKRQSKFTTMDSFSIMFNAIFLMAIKLYVPTRSMSLSIKETLKVKCFFGQTNLFHIETCHEIFSQKSPIESLL